MLPHRHELWTSPLPTECSTIGLEAQVGDGRVNEGARRQSVTNQLFACTAGSMRGTLDYGRSDDEAGRGNEYLRENTRGKR